jgi:hypothetical protein
MGKDMNSTQTTQRQRQRLLQMVNGATPVVQLYNVGYMIVAVEAERMTEPTAGCITMPSEADALRRICEAVDAGNPRKGTLQPQRHKKPTAAKIAGFAGQMLCTWRHYGEDAAAEDIADAMKQYPCLVNYGGTLRAINVHACGEAAIILKDMQA